MPNQYWGILYEEPIGYYGRQVMSENQGIYG